MIHPDDLDALEHLDAAINGYLTREDIKLIREYTTRWERLCATMEKLLDAEELIVKNAKVTKMYRQNIL